MGLFTKASLTFCVLNILRVISVVAICMALAGEIVTMVSDLRGVEAAKHSTSPTTSTNSAATNTASLRLLRRSPDLIFDRADSEMFGAPTASPTAFKRLPRAHRALDKRERQTTTSYETSTRVKSTPTPSITAPSASSTGATAAATKAEGECSYIGGTSVSKGVGGVLFSTLERIFIVIILFFALAAECPPPSVWTQRFWEYAFPPFGSRFGVGVLGTVQVFVGCTALSHSVSGYPLVAFWFLFITGFLNILFGLSFGAPLKELRSILPSPSQPGSSSALRSLRNNAAPHAGAAASSYYNFDMFNTQETEQEQTAAAEGRRGGSGRREKRAIRIAPAMVQAPAPPVYRGEQ